MSDDKKSPSDRKLRMDTNIGLFKDAIVYTEDDGPYYAVSFRMAENDPDENWRRARSAVDQIRAWIL